MARSSDGQLDLLDWTPPEPVVRFTPEQVRARSLCGRVAQAVGAALRDAAGRGESRDEIARRMTERMGQPVRRSVLDAYASEAREDRVISAPRFWALLEATGDRRLLEMMAEPLGWAVVERRHVPVIKLAAVMERQADLHRRARALRQQARAAGRGL